MLKSICTLVGVASVVAASPASAAVIFQAAGTASEANGWGVEWLVSLPTEPGRYRLEYTSTAEAEIYMAASYIRHWDVFFAPPPKPHNEFIYGSDVDVYFNEGVTATSATFNFVVPKTEYMFFNNTGQYGDAPIGAALYQETKFEDPYFYAGIWTNGPVDFDYTFKVTALPEPATWAMMILGFGLAGQAIRRRQTALNRA